MLVWIDLETFRFFCPDFADVLIGGESLQRFQSAGEVVSHPEGLQMGFQLVVRLIFDRCLLECDSSVLPGHWSKGGRLG